MGYKRKAHIVFLCGANKLSLMAEGFANALGNQWLEGRAAVLAVDAGGSCVYQVMSEAGVELSGRQGQALDAALLQWADLVVTMDEAAKAGCPPLPAGVQLRHYPFDDPDSGQATLTACRQIRDQVRARVEGMIGGMKLLQKASSD